MNKTRREWSVKYKCCKGKRDSLTAFYSLSSAIFVIAISFYGAVYFVGSKNVDAESLDDREVSRLVENISTAASTSVSNQTSPRTNLVINQDSDDDEILSG